MKTDPGTLNRMLTLFDKETQNEITVAEARELGYLKEGFTEALAREVKTLRIKASTMLEFIKCTIEIMENANSIIVVESDEDAAVLLEFEQLIKAAKTTLPNLSYTPWIIEEKL